MKGIAPTSAFPTPALGNQGNGGRNTYIIGPGLANFNAQFPKEFQIDRFAFEFRADVFNLFNRVNLTQPDSDLSSGQLGTPQAKIFHAQNSLGFTLASR